MFVVGPIGKCIELRRDVGHTTSLFCLLHHHRSQTIQCEEHPTLMGKTRVQFVGKLLQISRISGGSFHFRRQPWKRAFPDASLGLVCRKSKASAQPDCKSLVQFRLRVVRLRAKRF